jgi:hypothetical protein
MRQVPQIFEAGFEISPGVTQPPAGRLRSRVRELLARTLPVSPV